MIRGLKACRISLIVLILSLALIDATPGSLIITVSGRDADDRKVHKLTKSEIEVLKGKIGVREGGKDYNIVADGHGTGLAPPTEEEWISMVGATFIDAEGTLVQEGTSRRLDQEPFFPPIGDQGSQGSCVAWSTGYYTDGYLQAVTHGWTDVAIGGNASRLMSAAWIYNKANSGVDGGSWFTTCMDVVSSVGCATLSTMPYAVDDYISWGDEGAWREAPLYRTSPYEICNVSNIDVIKTWIDQGYPVCFSIRSSFSGYWSGIFGFDHILSSKEYPGGKVNHANTIVGYDDTISDDGDIGAFRVANSWGASWGDDGFYWLTYQVMDEIQAQSPLAFRCVPKNPDLSPYDPTFLATWRLGPAGDRGAPVELGIGHPSSPLATRRPQWDGSSKRSRNFPDFMCLDISEFESLYDSGTHKFYLRIGTASPISAITSFIVESYQNGYVPGQPDVSTDESPYVPAEAPVAVKSNYLPMAGFTFSPQNAGATDTILFADASYDIDGEVQRWEWHFGDGLNSTERNPTHMYAATGNYTVTLIVTDDDLTAGIQSRQVIVEPRSFVSVDGSASSSPALASNSDGLYLVVRGMDNGVYYRARNISMDSWSSWITISGSTEASPAMAILDGMLHVVVQGMDDGIYHRYMDIPAGTWSEWINVPGVTPSAPALATSTGELHLVVHGADDGIYYTSWTEGGGWGAWQKISGSTKDAPAIAVAGDRLHLVVRGVNDGIYHRYMDISTGTWSGWSFLSGLTKSPPSLIASGADRLDLFVRGMDDGIYHKAWRSGGGWDGAWEPMSGGTNDRPALSVLNNYLFLVVRGKDNSIYIKTMDLISGTWSGWTYIAGNTNAAPTVVSSQP